MSGMSLQTDPVTRDLELSGCPDWCREILLWLAKGQPSTDPPVDLTALGPGEWGILTQMASLHRLLAPCADAAAYVPRLPPQTAALMNLLRSSSRVVAQTRESGYGDLLTRFADASVQVVVLKGFVLARQCYEQIHHRPFNDLDVLVARADLDGAVATLHAAGFTQSERDSQTLQLRPISDARKDGYRNELQHLAEFTKRDATTGQLLYVDLHFRLSTVFDHIAPAVEPMLAAAIPVSGQSWLTLAPADFVTHLCYHAWWDTQSVDNVRRLRDLRLFQFADIARAMRAWQLSCPQVLHRAAELGVESTTNWGLVMATRLLGSLDGDDVLDDASASEVGRRISDRWLQRSTATPFGVWTVDSWDRIFAVDRAEAVLDMVWDQWFNPSLKRGDVFLWEHRETGA